MLRTVNEVNMYGSLSDKILADYGKNKKEPTYPPLWEGCGWPTSPGGWPTSPGGCRRLKEN